MKTKEEIIEMAADMTINSFIKEVKDKRYKIIEQLKKNSIHKSNFVIEMDARFFLEEEFVRYRD